MVRFIHRDVEYFCVWECIYFRLQLRSLIEVEFISKQQGLRVV